MVGRWSSPTLWQLLALGATLLLTTQAAVADPSPADSRRGMIFVRVHCSQCHAIGKIGESPLASAPPFRTLQIRYPVADLQRPLLEGIHPVMPRFQLTASQVLDVLAYFRWFER